MTSEYTTCNSAMKYTIIYLQTVMIGSNRTTRTEIERIETDYLDGALEPYAGNIVCVFEGWPRFVGEE
jgi:hypothetical protein